MNEIVEIRASARYGTSTSKEAQMKTIGSPGRWRVVGATLLLAVLAACGGEAPAESATPANESASGVTTQVMTVYKAPECDCCGRWVDHLRQAGFEVKVEEVSQQALGVVKARNGIGPELASCHTAEVEGYVIEGHVPADAIARLLREKPDVAGLAVPGMPIGSPGMEMPGRAPERYDVLALEKDGSTNVYESR